MILASRPMFHYNFSPMFHVPISCVTPHPTPISHPSLVYFTHDNEPITIHSLQSALYYLEDNVHLDCCLLMTGSHVERWHGWLPCWKATWLAPKLEGNMTFSHTVRWHDWLSMLGGDMTGSHAGRQHDFLPYCEVTWLTLYAGRWHDWLTCCEVTWLDPILWGNMTCSNAVRQHDWLP